MTLSMNALDIVLLSVALLYVVMLCVANVPINDYQRRYAVCCKHDHHAQCRNVEWHYAECHFAECRGVLLLSCNKLQSQIYTLYVISFDAAVSYTCRFAITLTPTCTMKHLPLELILTLMHN